MVTMACMDCGAVVFQAETLRGMLVAMMPHYFEAHHDVIESHLTLPREAWMKRFTAAYEASEA